MKNISRCSESKKELKLHDDNTLILNDESWQDKEIVENQQAQKDAHKSTEKEVKPIFGESIVLSPILVSKKEDEMLYFEGRRGCEVLQSQDQILAPF